MNWVRQAVNGGLPLRKRGSKDPGSGGVLLVCSHAVFIRRFLRQADGVIVPASCNIKFFRQNFMGLQQNHCPGIGADKAYMTLQTFEDFSECC